jgi:murein DD-endopeptidase MepM/ murein hydrolase activator NlpD
MTTSHRDLAQPHPWQRSLERSLNRRSITPAIRRSLARRRRASVALSTLMVSGPTGSLLAAGGFSLGGRVDVAQASPASRAIDNGATPAAMSFELGDRGTAVVEIQRQLGVDADGIFGPVTQTAVQDFQARNGLDVDGVVGPATWTALFGLEQAAAAAGARDGSVAVIVRERGDGAGAPGSGSDVGRDGQAGGGSSTGGGFAGETRPAVGGPSLGAPVADDGPLTGGRPGGGSSPGSTGNALGTGGTPVGDEAAPRTRPVPEPVSTPAPTTGACGPLRLSSPVKGTETSPFGPRWGRNHDGVDIAAPTGTPIRAAECGIVSFAGAQSGYGNMVCVKHSSRFETCYAHMTNYAVSQGQRVEQGQVIGYVGCTGNCTGPHLHFETRVDGSARDPRPYLAGGAVPGAPTVKAAANTKAAKAKLASTIQRDVQRARFAKAQVATTAEGGSSWSSVGGAQAAPTATTAVQDPAAATPATPTATTDPSATAPAAAPTPDAAVAPVPTTAAPDPAAAPAPTGAPAPTEAPAPTTAPTPEPVYEAPAEPTYAAPEPTYAAPQPAPAPAPAPVAPAEPTYTAPAPAPEPTATPDTTAAPVAETAPTDPAPTATPDPAAVAPPIETPPVETPPTEPAPVEVPPAPEPEPAPAPTP